MRIAIGLLLIASAAVADDVSNAIKLLKSRRPSEIVLGARTIRGIGPRAKKAAPKLIKLTAHDDAEVRIESGKALASIGSVSAKHLVRGLKSSKRPEQKLILLEVIAKIGRDMARYNGDLIKLLDDEDPAVREALVAALAKMSPECQPGLIRTLGAKSPLAREAAAKTLTRLGSAVVVPLVSALQEDDPMIRAGAAGVLGAIGPKASGASRVISDLRRDEDPRVRAAAAVAIGKIGGDAAHFVQVLIGMFNDPDPAVRSAAAEGAARFGKAAAPDLVTALGGEAQPYAMAALRRIGPKAVPSIDPALESESPRMRAAAVRLVAELTGNIAKSVNDITPLLMDAEASVRRAAAEALAVRGAQFADRDLLEACGDEDPGVRAAVVGALAQVKPTKEVEKAIETARSDAALTVRLAAEAARWMGGGDTKVLELARAHLGDDDPATRSAACRALAPMGRRAVGAIPELIDALETKPTPDVVDALGSIAAAHGNGLLGRAGRFKRLPGPTRTAIENAIAWLANCQDTKKSKINKADGRWHSKEFVRHYPTGVMTGEGFRLYSGGVTGLVVSLYLAIGRFDDPAVREGLEFLLRYQDETGYLNNNRSQHFLIAHAFATMAMCEAWIVTGEARYRRAALRAVRALEAARNPGLGWRYEPRGNENDTNVTTAALFALALAERGGIPVESVAMRGGARFIALMTDPTYGQIGYNVQGGSPARPAGMQDRFPPEESQAMTAAGLWGLALSERHAEWMPRSLEAARGLCAKLPPQWSGGRRDFYFWYYGTLVAHAQQGKRWSKWRSALADALIDNQRNDEPAYSGSWDPVGPWGADGGRIYSTAICALMLATPCRMTGDFVEGKPKGIHAEAAKALAKAARSEDPEIATRAARWLRRVGG